MGSTCCRITNPSSERNAQEWEALDAWIWLHFNLSLGQRSQPSPPPQYVVREMERPEELFKPTSATSIALHLISIVGLRFDSESMEFEDFVAKELGGKTLLDSYIAILIRAGLPDHIKQPVPYIPDNTTTIGNLINIIRPRQQKSIIQTM